MRVTCGRKAASLGVVPVSWWIRAARVCPWAPWPEWPAHREAGGGWVEAVGTLYSTAQNKLYVPCINLSSSSLQMLYFMQREIYCKGKSCQYRQNRYHKCLSGLHISWQQWNFPVSGGGVANDLRCCIIGLLFLVAEVLKDHTDVIFKFKPKMVCLRR